MIRTTVRILAPLVFASFAAAFAGGCSGGDSAGGGLGAPPQLGVASLADVGAGAVSLKGNWTFNEDANQNDPAPFMSVENDSDTQVSATYDGNDGSRCDCNAEHLVIPLGKTIDCATGTIEFDYSTQGKFGSTSTSSVSIRFCNGGQCDESGFYSGDQFLASEQAGHSNCAMPFQNEFPGAPQVAEGHNKIALGDLESSLNGQCTGSFDTIDIHMQGYACYKGQDNAQATLANLRIY
jgi:hypothetical protein